MLNLEEPIFCHPNGRPSEVSRRGLSRSSTRLEFFAGPMESHLAIMQGM